MPYTSGSVVSSAMSIEEVIHAASANAAPRATTMKEPDRDFTMREKLATANIRLMKGIAVSQRNHDTRGSLVNRYASVFHGVTPGGLSRNRMMYQVISMATTGSK